MLFRSAMEGSSEVFLALFPFGKAANLAKGLTKRSKAALGLSKTRKAELAQAMGETEAQFVRLAGRLERAKLLSSSMKIDGDSRDSEQSF